MAKSGRYKGWLCGAEPAPHKQRIGTPHVRPVAHLKIHYTLQKMMTIFSEKTIEISGLS